MGGNRQRQHKNLRTTLIRKSLFPPHVQRLVRRVFELTTLFTFVQVRVHAERLLGFQTSQRFVFSNTKRLTVEMTRAKPPKTTPNITGNVDKKIAVSPRVHWFVSRVFIFSTPFHFTQLYGKRGASLVSKLRAADLNLFKKRLTAEMTRGETESAQLWVHQRPR